MPMCFFAQAQPVSKHPELQPAIPFAPASHPMLELQATIGNRATNQWIAAQQKTPDSRQPIQAKSEFQGLAQTLMDESTQAEALPATLTTGTTTSQGKPMPEAVQQKMEAAFNTDFSDVRIHEGPEAEAIGAIAFTRGQDIHFAPGQYNPTNFSGQVLLGHELAHVLQQREGRVKASKIGNIPINSEPALEGEAESISKAVGRGEKIKKLLKQPSQRNTTEVDHTFAIQCAERHHASMQDPDSTAQTQLENAVKKLDESLKQLEIIVQTHPKLSASKADDAERIKNNDALVEQAVKKVKDFLNDLIKAGEGAQRTYQNDQASRLKDLMTEAAEVITQLEEAEAQLIKTCREEGTDSLENSLEKWHLQLQQANSYRKGLKIAATSYINSYKSTSEDKQTPEREEYYPLAMAVEEVILNISEAIVRNKQYYKELYKLYENSSQEKEGAKFKTEVPIKNLEKHKELYKNSMYLPRKSEAARYRWARKLNDEYRKKESQRLRLQGFAMPDAKGDSTETYYVPKEKLEDYRIKPIIEDGNRNVKIVHAKDSTPVDSTGVNPARSISEESEGGKYIYVMLPDGQIYVADQTEEEHKTRNFGFDPAFHHSSIPNGKRVAAAGELRFVDGELIEITDQSGHYTPEIVFTYQAVTEFKQWGVDLASVKVKLLYKDEETQQLNWIELSAESLHTYCQSKGIGEQKPGDKKEMIDDMFADKLGDVDLKGVKGNTQLAREWYFKPKLPRTDSFSGEEILS